MRKRERDAVHVYRKKKGEGEVILVAQERERCYDGGCSKLPLLLHEVHVHM